MLFKLFVFSERASIANLLLLGFGAKVKTKVGVVCLLDGLDPRAGRVGLGFSAAFAYDVHWCTYGLAVSVLHRGELSAEIRGASFRILAAQRGQPAVLGSVRAHEQSVYQRLSAAWRQVSCSRSSYD